jgi:large subunit ribosomal protein L15
MVLNKRKKVSRHRGSWTHSWGEKKKRRGAGSRGGRGNAGTGKRGDVKKPSIQANTKYFGKYGFTSINRKSVSAINVSAVESQIVQIGEKKGTTYVVDLTKAGYDKLLGSGLVTLPLEVTVAVASPKAVEKIEAAGGKVVIPGSEE